MLRYYLSISVYCTRVKRSHVLIIQQAIDALRENIVDSLGGLPETLKFIDEMKLTSRADKGVFGALKREMWRETVDYLEKISDESLRETEKSIALVKEDKMRKERVGKWEAKAKL